jgi:hypothetical protein
MRLGPNRYGTKSEPQHEEPHKIMTVPVPLRHTKTSTSAVLRFAFPEHIVPATTDLQMSGKAEEALP